MLDEKEMQFANSGKIVKKVSYFLI
jgi:hypothetical protein